MTAPVSHEGTGFDSDEEMMQAYADESPAADHVKMTAKRTIDAGQLVTSADVKPKVAPAVRVTEVVGYYWAHDGGEGIATDDDSLTLADLLPGVDNATVRGKRGRFKIVVSWEEER